MCGIAGFYNSEKSVEELHVVGRRMVEQLHHRGPDANGVAVRHSSNGSRVLLAHARLSIIDLTDAGTQPMVSGDGTLWIIFNGEIYNYLEIRQELRCMGVTFKTDSDTEVILAAYRHWGLKCFDRFVGMWAIALWDEKLDQLLLSRDRLGIKPLYYSQQGDTLVFGSEPKVILEQVPECRKVNLQALSDYFSYRYVLGGGSFFTGIHSVEAGSHLIIRNKQLKTIRYWDLPVISDKFDPGEDQVRQKLEELMMSAVGYRMIADVPVGSFLSGGLDSSILVREMAEQQSFPIKTFTIGFQEEGYNEFQYADEVAQYCGTDHKEILLDVQQYLQSFQKMLHIKDAPLAVPNEIALHELSKKLKEDITVVLSGEGADELFGGYGRIFRSAYDYQRVYKTGNNTLSTTLRDNLLKKYRSLEWDGEVDHFLGQYSYLDVRTKENIFAPDVLSALGDDPHNYNFFHNKWAKLDGLDLHEKYMWIFQRVHLEGLLGRLDSSTMSASVEGRVPFVDHRLIEYVNGLPLHYKIRWGSEEQRCQAENLNSDQISENFDITKYVLRSQYESRLPKSITERRKVGFPVPLGEWLSGTFRDYAEERLLSNDARTGNIFQRQAVEQMLNREQADPRIGLQAWMLLNVEDWMRAYSLSL
ncbi:MAG: asparagine synthase (glutamine-hydrolyzing) [Desulfobulbaceae bacterium]|nr:asparagine synthase (glutamine-hydrolyzing) [Desulfobulbaceae bacterium]